MIKHITTYDEWINARKYGIGGSDAAAVLGVSPFKSNTELYNEKAGIAVPEDISDKPYVIFGKKAEEHIRGLYALNHPEYAVSYSEFDMHINEEHPFIYATLDGILTDINGRQGVLEIKTTEIRKQAQWKEWENKVPDHYYCQIIHQLAATGFDFAVLTAFIKYKSTDGDFRFTMREYHFDRVEKQTDIDYLIKKEAEFWHCVVTHTAPNTILPEI